MVTAGVVVIAGDPFVAVATLWLEIGLPPASEKAPWEFTKTRWPFPSVTAVIPAVRDATGVNVDGVGAGLD